MIDQLPPEILALMLVVVLVLTPLLKRGVRRKIWRDATRGRPQGAIGELRGRAYVIDGDTLVIKRMKVRLAGIDAPELDQPFGQKSKWAMVELCKGQVITARVNGETSHDRLVGTCYLPDGRDIGAELVKLGLALDWTHHSGGKYRGLEPLGVRRKLHNKTAWKKPQGSSPEHETLLN